MDCLEAGFRIQDSGFSNQDLGLPHDLESIGLIEGRIQDLRLIYKAGTSD
jgi:hypothetical protein